MQDDSNPPTSKLTRTKQLWARAGKFLTGRVSRPENDRLPPGQHLVRDWPVLDLGLQPMISRENWRLDVFGAVDHPVTWTSQDYLAQPQATEICDIHCVTTWSRYDSSFEGLPTLALAHIVHPKAEATHVILHAADGYTTNLSCRTFSARMSCSPMAGTVNLSPGSMAAPCG